MPATAARITARGTASCSCCTARRSPRSITDADGEFARRVRALVGPDMPIGVSMDLHGNLTPLLVESVTVANLYRTNPHLDARIRARECAELIVRAVRGEIHPVAAIETPPLVVNIVKQFTGAEPMLRHDGGCRGGRSSGRGCSRRAA